MLPLGPHLVDYEFKGKQKLPSPGIPALNIGRVTVREVSDTSARASWILEEQDFMKECNRRTPRSAEGKLLCEATLVNDLLQGGVFTMALWQFSDAGRLGPYGRASVSHLIIVDPRVPRMDAIGLNDLSRMRLECARSGISSRPAVDLPRAEGQDSDLPAYIAQAHGGLLLVFRSEGAAQLVSVKGSRAQSCREIYLPQTSTLSWASSVKGVIAAAPQAGFRWAPSGEAGTSEPRYEPLQIVCSGTFGRAETPSGRQNSAAYEARIKDICR
jgi:hypothetical protein